MSRLASALAIFLVSALSGVAAEEKNDAGKFEIDSWQVRPDLATAPDLSRKDGQRKPLPGFELKSGARDVRYDASGFVKAAGIDLPPGSEVYYDPASNSVVARSTAKTLDCLEALFVGYPDLVAANLSVEFSVFECKSGAMAGPEASQPPTYRDLQTLPPGDITCLARVSTYMEANHHASVSQTQPLTFEDSGATSSTKSESPGDERWSFRPGEGGIKAEIDCVFEPDGATFVTDVHFHFRDPHQKLLPEISFATSYTGWEGYPAIVHVSPISGMPERALVVVATANIVNPGGWRFHAPIPPKKIPDDHGGDRKATHPASSPTGQDH
jgi:hypothetical protein